MSTVLLEEAEEHTVVGGLLTAFLRDALRGEPFSVAGLRRTTSGLSRENWVFDLVGPDGTAEPMILRRDPAASLLHTDREVELQLLRALQRTAVPAPRVRWADIDGRRLGRPALVMERAPGVCDYLVLNGDRPQAERARLAGRFCELLALVHKVDVGAAGLRTFLPDPGPEAARAAVDEWLGTLHTHVDGAYPELEAAAVWLRRTAPISSRSVLVHGDFKPGNALLEGEEITALLDWETAHLGDPLEDLGWVTQPTRTDEHQIAGCWEQRHIVARYQELTGAAVDPAALEWWRTFASFKSAVIALCGLTTWLRGQSDRLFREPATWLRPLLTAMRQP